MNDTFEKFENAALLVSEAAQELAQRAAALCRAWPKPKRAHQPWTPEQDDQLLDLLDEGRQVEQIAPLLGRSILAIYVRLDKKHSRLLRKEHPVS